MLQMKGEMPMRKLLIVGIVAIGTIAALGKTGMLDRIFGFFLG